MADNIKLLPDHVANQIAAGEVVNRPASVVKELVENAVDAGAKKITVNIKDGGKTLIHVADDGKGMSPVDARMAFERHATSKIDSVEDIYQLHTFGFRGEALASICSVSEVELRTRQRDAELGTKVEIHGNKFISQQPFSCPEGTQFFVRNLFFNVPARRRFLDKSSTETKHIVSEYQRIALCNPDISFELYENDSLVSKLPVSGLRQRIINLIGKNIQRNLLEVSTDTTIVKLTGFTGRPESARQTNKEQFLFVNGRYFKNPYFHKAIVSSYEKLIQPGTQPSYFLFLEIEPEKIDVNVHPQKTEVKFEDGTEIWQIINAAVRESLARSGAVPAMDFDMDDSLEIPVFRERESFRIPSISANPQFNPFDNDRKNNSPSCGATDNGSQVSRLSYPVREDIDDELTDDDRSVLEYIEGIDSSQQYLPIEGIRECTYLQVGQKYAISSENGMINIYDLSRAWECILYDKYLTMLESGNSACQHLLFPESLILSNDDISLVSEALEDLHTLGFDISFTDDHTVLLKGVPADFLNSEAKELLFNIMDSFREHGKADDTVKKKKLAGSMAASAARASAKIFTAEETERILHSLQDVSDPSYTPSGKKVSVVLSTEQIMKLFTKN